MTDDKIPFLRARLDEDEQVAFDALDGGKGSEWRANGASVEVSGGLPADASAFDETVVFNEGSPTEEQAQHIARHDPARVLRETPVKKARLALYEGALQRWADLPGSERPTVAGESLRIKVTTLEVVIQGDLQAYANHPDFRPHWLM
ncbi:DUF6221 family protein [Streptomyces sp. NPDC048674]|uniref:DUF6221 family protein n=1 Tax=Streptomyces sp. NPDC048674 TaxID=3155491 RepID=UPI0034350BBF